MIHLRLAIFAALVFAVCPRPADAQDQPVTFKGKSFELPMPADFCIPGAANGFATRVKALLANSGNTTVKIGADCGELRAGHNQYDFIVYYYPASTEDEVLDGNTQARRKAVCDELRAQNQSAVADVQSIVDKTARELKQKMATNDTKYLGVLAEDAHGCYAGLLSSNSLGSTRYILSVNLLGTVIHARRFYMSLYAEYKTPAQAEQMLARQQALAAELDAKNPE
jgi:hypothetical protein